MREEYEHQEPESQEEKMQKLRSKATEYLLREEWSDSIQAYSQYISLCQYQISNPQPNPDPDHISNLQKSLCLVFSNRAEARSKLRDFALALQDCDQALQIESTHFKTLLCKGKILLNLNRYGMALNCFEIAVLDPQANSNPETLNGYFEKCKKLESLSKSGAFDISGWVLSGFKGSFPELAEYIGAVEIKKSDISGRGLFVTKNVESGTLLLVTKAIATERCILPQSTNDGSGENAQLVMWTNLIDKVVESASKCQRTRHLIYMLSDGNDEEGLEVPDIGLFRPEGGEGCFSNEMIDMCRMLTIMDVNSLVEETFSSRFSSKNSDYHGIGLWLLSSFINHSCSPNVKRIHVGDYVLIHACGDIKAGEEITLGYFNVFMPLSNRKEMAKNWGFSCGCKRCKFDEGMYLKQEMKEIEVGFDRGLDVGCVVYKLEESMRRWMVRGKGKGYLRASFWKAYAEVFESDKLMRRWGRRIPAREMVVESIVEAVGGDERVLKVFIEGAKRNGSSGGVVEMERAIKLGRGVYGKIMKKQALRSLLELGMHEPS